MDLIEISKDSKKDDLEDVVDMLRSQQTRFSGSRAKLKVDQFLQMALEVGSPAKVFLLKKSDGTSVGMAFTNLCIGFETGGKYLWVNELYINLEHRKKGYGKLLSKALMTWCAKNGVHAIYAVTSPLNKASQAMMRQVGCKLTNTIWCDKQI
jgi:L-amino acid N-acyltransferase YncA